MVEHVYRRSAMAPSLSDLFVATCDREIEDAVISFGGKSIMTMDTHERASDRVAEAMLKIEAEQNKTIDIVVMIQGDEPMIFPEMIDDALRPLLEDKRIEVSNLMAPLKDKAEHEDPNEVKVVVDQDDFALYFSREPIPSRKKGHEDVTAMKQVCIIPFRHDFLLQFNSMPQTPLEVIESVDMLRVLESGYKVKMVPTQHDTYSVDTLADLQKVEKLMVDDPLVDKYHEVNK
jgi:3-deoxy-manno-octulosonate cytidylyltransferase (CMP-KDO synthetase)